VNAAGQTALTVAAVLVIVAAVTFTKRLNRERAAVLWSGFAPVDDDSSVELVHVRWAEARDGTRWSW